MIIVLGVLWCGAFSTWMFFLTRERFHPWTWTGCERSRFLFDFGRYYSSLLLVMMSFEKFFALYFPLKTKSIYTVRNAKRVCLVVARIFIVYFLQIFFTRKAGKNKNGSPTCTLTNVSSGFGGYLGMI